MCCWPALSSFDVACVVPGLHRVRREIVVENINSNTYAVLVGVADATRKYQASVTPTCFPRFFVCFPLLSLEFRVYCERSWPSFVREHHLHR